MDLLAAQHSLRSLAKINVVLGKNGCGKSTLLKALESDATQEGISRKKYVTPERGGTVAYEANVEGNMISSPDWVAQSRRVNQFHQFRQQSVAQFRRLEITVLRQSEAASEVADFGAYMQQLNSLLDNIELRRDTTTFGIYSKRTGNRLEPTMISSGESELISLGIEILMFANELEEGENVLFLDEPDVHLHPDLQSRLVSFLVRVVTDHDFRVVIATHSTALLGGLADYEGAAVGFMRSGDTELTLEKIADVHRRVLPVFGAHPLSNIFNESPVLLVEGDDDERLWQQAVKSADRKLKLYPVPCGGKPSLSRYEAEVRRIVESVYDSGVAYSLRDGDGVVQELDDSPPVVRIRLACRAAENLLLTDEVLALAGTSWDEAVKRIETWIDANTAHSRHGQMVAFRDGGYDRKQFDMKDIRMLLVDTALDSNKPWEVLVGQAIGKRFLAGGAAQATNNSLDDFLGAKAADILLGLPNNEA